MLSTALLQMVSLASGAQGVPGHVAGTVVDPAGRPLPFVHVTTASPVPARTEHASPVFETLTDLRGGFSIPDSMIPRDTVWVSAAGYGSMAIDVQSGGLTRVTLERVPTGTGNTEIGLVVNPRMFVRHRKLSTLVGNSLTTGQHYEIVVSMAGTACVAFGPTLMEEAENSLTVAVSTTRQPGVCTSAYVEQDIVVPFVAGSPGMLQIRLIGRWADVVSRFAVRD